MAQCPDMLARFQPDRKQLQTKCPDAELLAEILPGTTRTQNVYKFKKAPPMEGAQ